MENNDRKKRVNPKILPNSFEAEQGIIACILLDENSSVKILPYLKEIDFYNNSHKVIFKNMYEIYCKAKPVDFVTLTNALDENNELEQVGGIDYITTLTNFLPSSSNYKYYLEIVLKNSKLRQLILAGQDIILNAFESDDDKKALDYAEKRIFEISQKNQFSDLQQIGIFLPKVIEKLDMIAKDNSILRGIPSGFKDLDAITKGWQKSDLIILAARPGVGKTTLAMNFVNHASVECNKNCAVFSLEMSTEQLAQRSLFSVGCVSMEDALNGVMADDKWQSIWYAEKKLLDAKIFVDDNGYNTPMDIRSKCRRLKKEHGLDLVIIDYLGLMEADNKSKNENKTQEIAKITRDLKRTAKELNVPIILLSQLSRAGEQRKENHQPMLSDLRDSGAIEQDADIVMFIYNPDKYNDVSNPDGEGVVQLEIAKHRNGRTGVVKLRWISEWLRFVDIDYKVKIPPKSIKINDKLEEIKENDE